MLRKGLGLIGTSLEAFGVKCAKKRNVTSRDPWSRVVTESLCHDSECLSRVVTNLHPEDSDFAQFWHFGHNFFYRYPNLMIQVDLER